MVYFQTHIISHLPRRHSILTTAAPRFRTLRQYLSNYHLRRPINHSILHSLLFFFCCLLCLLTQLICLLKNGMCSQVLHLTPCCFQYSLTNSIIMLIHPFYLSLIFLKASNQGFYLLRPGQQILSNRFYFLPELLLEVKLYVVVILTFLFLFVVCLHLVRFL